MRGKTRDPKSWFKTIRGLSRMVDLYRYSPHNCQSREALFFSVRVTVRPILRRKVL